MTFFVICMGVGVVFLIVSAALGGLGDFGGHFDIGGHDVDVGGGDLGGGGDAAGAQLSPLSPIIVAFFLTAFGGMGIVSMQLLEIGFKLSILVALVTALAAGTIVYLTLVKVFASTQGGVEVNVADMAGLEAEVLTGIPAGGVGEIAFTTAGGRLNVPARSDDGTAIPYNSLVRIVRVVGSTYIVQRQSPTTPPPVPPGAGTGTEV